MLVSSRIGGLRKALVDVVSDHVQRRCRWLCCLPPSATATTDTRDHRHPKASSFTFVPPSSDCTVRLARMTVGAVALGGLMTRKNKQE